MEITYKYYSSFEINEKEKNDFIKVFNEVFNENWTSETFNRKYIENIYGNSYIIIAYDNTLPVGIRSYWRNDLYGKKSFQLVDTGVLLNYRKKGIYKKMVNISEANMEKGYFYAFPNKISRITELKTGFKNKCTFYRKPLFWKFIKDDEIKFIEDDYIKWIFTGSKKKYYYISKNSKCYLLKKESGKKYTILGEFNENLKENFEKIEKCNIYLYTPKKTFLTIFGRYTFPITEKDFGEYENEPAPYYKADYLMNER